MTQANDATHAKIPPEIAAGVAVWAPEAETVWSGRRSNEGHEVPQTRDCRSDVRAPVYEPRVGRWYLRASGCAFDLDHQCTRSHLGDWPDCMGRTLDERHRISTSRNRKALVGSEGSR